MPVRSSDDSSDRISLERSRETNAATVRRGAISERDGVNDRGRVEHAPQFGDARLGRDRQHHSSMGRGGAWWSVRHLERRHVAERNSQFIYPGLGEWCA